MDDCLRLGCPAAFENVHAEHLMVESPGVTPARALDGGLLLFSVHGTAVISAPRGDVTLRPNEAFLLPSDGGIPAIRFSSPAELYLVGFRQERRGRNAARRLDVPDHVTVLRPGRLTSLVRRLVDEVRQPAASPAILHHLLVLALCELARSSGAGDAAEEKEAVLESIASRVDAFIAAHYHEPIGTPDIARELHYNPDYLERAYRLERHMSIREAIHARRIKEAAAQLLLQRGKGVAEIAALCGYADAGYFRRVFKRATSMTPHGYRLSNSALRQAAGIAEGARA
jgi:AraC-like DNA-binding protein